MENREQLQCRPRRLRLLVATTVEAAKIVASLLGGHAELVHLHTMREALGRLAAGDINVIVAGLRFDDSVIPMLLEKVKADERFRRAILQEHVC